MNRRRASAIARTLAVVASIALAGAPARAQVSSHRKVLSGSMEPTIHRGEDVEISVFAYLWAAPARGDVVVFRPPGEQHFYVHRVVGVPGDRVAYDEHKRLSINGAPVDLVAVPETPPADWPDTRVFWERLPGSRHQVLIDDSIPSTDIAPGLRKEPTCQARGNAFQCVVPPDRFFLMGDNRDHARDSRYLGFIASTDIPAKVSSGDTPAREGSAGPATRR